MKKNASVTITLLGLLLLFLLALPARAQNVETYILNPGTTDFKSDLPEPKLDHQLAKLVQIYRTGGLPAVREMARYHPQVDLISDRVKVVAHIRRALALDGPHGDLRDFVAFLGGQVELAREQVFQLQIPLTGIEKLAARRDIRRIRLPLKPHLHVVTEGYEFSGADQFETLNGFQNYHTPRVGILDLGFNGYQSLLGSELPDEVTTKSFRWDGDINGGTSHGTACAEIVHDMCGQAKLYFANFNTLTEMGEAVEWFIEQEVDIISSSIGWYNAGAGDGTGPVCRLVDLAAANNVLWINSSGNDANSHWEGQFVDDNLNGFCDFGGDDIFSFYMPAYQSLWVYMNWNDWGTWDGSEYSGSANDYDLYLYYYSGGWHYVDSSLQAQNGVRGQWPVEGISGWYSTSPLQWGIKVKKKTGAASKKIELFFDFNYSYNHEFNHPWGSVAIPADSANALAVGAIPWLSGYTDYYYTYSGRGPTEDFRIKPDLTAASSVSNETYGTFGGTSASCPHVAGAIALLYHKTPFSPQDIVELLLARADDWGATGKDNIFGEGKLDIDD